MRDAPSIAIVQALIDAGADIVAYDPEGMEAAKSLMPQVAMAANAYDAVTGADAVVLVTEWDAFRGIDLDQVGELMKSRVLVDLRNVYNPGGGAGFRLVLQQCGSQTRTTRAGRLRALAAAGPRRPKRSSWPFTSHEEDLPADALAPGSWL